MKERRALVRQRTLIKGRIYFNNRLSSMDCLVRDLTANGARLEFSANVTLPDAFELYIPTRNEYFRARIKWRKGNHLGITWTPEEAAKEHAEHGDDAGLADRLERLEREVAVLHRRLDALHHP
jgi:hypothetical protein